MAWSDAARRQIRQEGWRGSKTALNKHARWLAANPGKIRR